jgi:hypothetical protein
VNHPLPRAAARDLLAFVQAVSEVNTNEVETSGSISVIPSGPFHISGCYSDPNRAPAFPWTPKYNWNVTLASEPWGIIQKEDGEDTYFCFGSLWWYTVPVSAPTIALSTAGLSVALVVFALLACRCWRRRAKN